MGRVTFSGPVKSNGGFELGQSGSGSSYSGVTVISSGGALTVTTGSLSTITVASANFATSSTANQVQIGGAITGWNNPYVIITTVASGTTAAYGITQTSNSVTMNMSLGSVFRHVNAGAAGSIVTPVGGYPGQRVTLIYTTLTASALVFASSASVAIKIAYNGTASNITGYTILPGSTCSVTFVNTGPQDYTSAQKYTGNLSDPTTFAGSVLVVEAWNKDLGAQVL